MLKVFRINKTILLAIVVSLSLYSCAPSRLIKPINKGEKQINASLGGPLINYAGTTIPIPFTSLTYAYGLEDNTTLYGSLHSTSLLFGVLQSEVGLVYQLKQPDSLKFYKLGVSVSPSLNFMIDRWQGNFRFYPKYDFNIYSKWSKKRNHLAYLGFSNWFDFYENKAHNMKNQYFIIGNFHGGLMLNSGKWNHQLECKLFPLFNSYIVVDYSPMFNNVPWGIYYSISKNF